MSTSSQDNLFLAEVPPEEFDLTCYTVKAYRARYGDAVPNQECVYAFLLALRDTNGHSQAHAMAHILKDGLGRLHGVAITSLVHTALRDIFVLPKAKVSVYDKALRAIVALPDRYAERLLPILTKTEVPLFQATAGVVWSLDHICNTCITLNDWLEFCVSRDMPEAPSGAKFIEFAAHLCDRGVSPPSIAIYFSRVRSVFEKVLTPQTTYPGAMLVQKRWEDIAKQSPYIFKSNDQIVGASPIFWHGLGITALAEEPGLTPLSRAVQMRDGILLALSVAVPERAKALCSLQFSTSLRLRPPDIIAISLPGNVLKMRETQKATAERSVEIQNAVLWNVLNDYVANYRRLIDNSMYVFPDTHAYGKPLSVAGIRTVIKRETGKRFGIAIPTHRMRDNAATEAVEVLPDKGSAGPALLNHADERTFQKHYDHSESIETCRAFNFFVAKKKGPTITLDI